MSHINCKLYIRESAVQEGKEVEMTNFDIQLDDVTFGYDVDQKVLKGVSFIAKQGQVTALVGISGCGKTSILRLVSRLYDYDMGKIYDWRYRYKRNCDKIFI